MRENNTEQLPLKYGDLAKVKSIGQFLKIWAVHPNKEVCWAEKIPPHALFGIWNPLANINPYSLSALKGCIPINSRFQEEFNVPLFSQIHENFLMIHEFQQYLTSTFGFLPNSLQPVISSLIHSRKPHSSFSYGGDLLVTNIEVAFQLRQYLRKIFDKPSSSPLSPLLVDHHKYIFQNFHPHPRISFSAYYSSQYRKLNQVLFKGSYFRILYQHPWQKIYPFFASDSDFHIYPLGTLLLRGHVVQDESWWNFPSIISISNPEIIRYKPLSSFNTILTTHHLDFSDISQIWFLPVHFLESLKLLETGIIAGRLELVRDERVLPEITYLRVVPGYYSHDRIILQ